MPGVYQPVSGSTLSFRGGINVAGSNEVSNYSTLDGFNNNDASISGPSLRPSIDAIQEFRVLTGTYEAEYGHNTGGQVVVVTKSGSNAYHGNLYEFLRNEIVEARPYFTPAGVKPPLKRNQFGGTFGGPILRDKTFFFFNYEGLRSRKGLALNSNVPTLAMRSGVFPGIAPASYHSPIGYAPGTFVPDPVSNTTTLHTANFTPAQTTSYQIGQALLAFYPAPNSTGTSNYRFVGKEQETDDQYSLRLDHTFRASDTLYATLNYFNGPLITPNNPLCGNYTIPGFLCYAGLTTQLYGGGWTHTFTPSLINTFRAGYQRLRQPRYVQSAYNFDVRYGIPALGTNPPANIGGVPTTTITGFAGFGSPTNLPQDRGDNTYDFNDAVLLTHGRHNLKAGVNIPTSGAIVLFLSTGTAACNSLD